MNLIDREGPTTLGVTDSSQVRPRLDSRRALKTGAGDRDFPDRRIAVPQVSAVASLREPLPTIGDLGLYERMWALAQNLWWSWQPDVVTLFHELDPSLWHKLHHNPIALLREFPAERLNRRANELGLDCRIIHAHRRMLDYLANDKAWGITHAGCLQARPVVYLSAEFGLHESLPIYSGGLGVLAGDHIKSASDLGVPMVAVGLFYDHGYFHQRLDQNGWQQEEYITADVSQLPISLLTNTAGKPIFVDVQTRGGPISAQVWKLAVGRTMLLLLDTNVPGNRPEDRELTSRLYGGDSRIRIRQELLLGVGGVRAITALGIRPGAIHLNEGHSAFAGLELVRLRMFREGLQFEEAIDRVAAMTVFTTHTPVAAGHDRFSAEAIEEHLGPMRDALGLSHDKLMALGRVNPHNFHEEFCMTTLALKLSRCANGVSALHGQVSRQMWAGLWPGRSKECVPIGHITNGVHVHSWLAPQMHALYDRHFGPDWAQRSGEPEVWNGIEEVDDAELWETHQELKSRLIDFVRRRAARQCAHRGEPARVIDQARHSLNINTLTIGFARRFATYKRATLLLHDLERLVTLMDNPRMPMQLVFAGKAHPRDQQGKELLQQVAELTRDPRFAQRIVFVEDYDIDVGRHLVQGVDIWLNNPRRPLEASGTSGQKVVLNGGLNLSVLDGWWAEAYDGANGFAIGHGETHISAEVQDRRDAESLHHMLEHVVIPMYYERDDDGLPRAWIALMKRAIRVLGWRFNADRMVMNYTLRGYLRAAGGLSCDMSPLDFN